MTASEVKDLQCYLNERSFLSNVHHKHEHVKSFEKNFDLIKDTNQFRIFYGHI